MHKKIVVGKYLSNYLFRFLATVYSAALPSYMTGKFKLYDSDNYDEFMEELGKISARDQHLFTW